MSIQSQITRIINARDSSFSAIESKGVTVPSDANIESLPSLISQISGGGTDIDFIVVGNYGLYLDNFEIENNVLISEKGTVTGNTLVLT